MSDGFDKEAEREKLREKFAEDERKREHTQRMSELLLQGATMTNRHCDACGDPIFRHDGREFCPSCHATEDGYAVPDDDGSTPDAADNRSAEVADAPGSDDAIGSSGTIGSSDPTGSGDLTTGTPSGGTAGAATPTAAGAAEGMTERSATGSVDGVDEARASLTRTLTRFARAAEGTDDPRRAREHLEAAREAAATLAALDR